MNHHSPFLRPDIAPTEVVDPKDVGNLDEVEEDGEELTDEEMKDTMRRLGLSWNDERQTAMVGTTSTYDMIDQVEVFLDTRLKVEAMTLIVPGVRRFDFSRSEFGKRLLSYVTSADPPGDEMDEEEEEEEEEMGGGDGDEVVDAEVLETPP